MPVFTVKLGFTIFFEIAITLDRYNAGRFVADFFVIIIICVILGVRSIHFVVILFANGFEPPIESYKMNKDFNKRIKKLDIWLEQTLKGLFLTSSFKFRIVRNSITFIVILFFTIVLVNPFYIASNWSNGIKVFIPFLVLFLFSAGFVGIEKLFNTFLGITLITGTVSTLFWTFATLFSNNMSIVVVITLIVYSTVCVLANTEIAEMFNSILGLAIGLFYALYVELLPAFVQLNQSNDSNLLVDISNKILNSPIDKTAVVSCVCIYSFGFMCVLVKKYKRYLKNKYQ